MRHKSIFQMLAWNTMAAFTILTTACGTGESGDGKSSDTDSTEAIGEVSNGTFDVNLSSSSIIWQATMVGMYTHEGNIAITSANLKVENGSVTGGKVVADLMNIMPTDNNFDDAKGSTKDKLIGHLQSADFFDAANFPNATFEITGSSGSELTGNLTIRGISNPEKVSALNYDAATRTWTGNLTFNRKKYNVAWDSPMKEMVVADDVILVVKLVL